MVYSSSDTETVDKETHMAEPNNYITATRKNFISNDNEGRMVEKCIVEIQGTFFEKIPGAAYEWFTKECMGSIGTWDSMVEKFIMKFHHLSDHNDDEDVEEEEDPNKTNNAPKIFTIEGNLFDFETPLCKTFNEFNCFMKIDIDLFTYDIQDLKPYDEYEQELNNDEAKATDEPWLEKGGTIPTIMVGVRSMTYFQDHIWYDELADGKLKDETLALKGKIEGSWGDATSGVMKFCRWLKCCFENFHEPEYEVLVKLQECWWKVNAHEITSFTRIENSGRGPHANMKTEWVSNPYLDTNRIFRSDYEASNVGYTQENQEHKGDPIPEPSNYKIRIFEMMKYSFSNDEEYITLKESQYLNHSKDSLDAYRELLRLINEGWVVTTPEE
ncbi:hypothetical protein Tco_1248136 [Tanacetum coccineum]